MTRLHPDVPEVLRGTYLGLSMDPILEHLVALGVTAVELMPVHHAVTERALADRGLTNYWGYNSIAFFAPDVRYASGRPGSQVGEFKTMVKRIHGAGIEVILDVVYNHTAEGNHLGPTLSLRGIDNVAYYRLVPENRRHYVDFTGCGNSLNMLHPRTIQLIMDSLRYWVRDMHVDGFRFDLAPALARELYDVNRLGTFFDIIHQDPLLSQVKLIAEPWDVGPGGYQVGNFPIKWAEWNGRYRDTVRHYWKGDGGTVSDLASRLAGSNDLYAHNGRQPYASINFITAHDGFTLQDLVSYNEKHNDANLEGNRDGENHNLSSNGGVEGPTEDPAIRIVRERQKRNFLATLLMSQGVPMISHGDEMGRTQRGNNNAYCQDNPLSWADWTLDEDRRRLLAFTTSLIRFRLSQPTLRRRRYFQGRHIRGGDVKDLVWFAADGREMNDDAWNADFVRSIGMLLSGSAIEELNERGEPTLGDTLMVLLNAHTGRVPFVLPAPGGNLRWQRVFDTFDPHARSASFKQGARYPLQGRSVAVLKTVAPVRNRRRAASTALTEVGSATTTER